MIKTEIINNRIRHYSDNGYMIRQIETNILYEDAIDIIPCPYTYEETNEFIPDVEIEIEAQEALDILIGGSNG